MFQRFCFIILLCSQLSYFSFAVEPDKKTSTLQLIETITQLPFLKNETDFADYLPSFYTPVHVYKEEGDRSIVELISAEHEVLYRVEVSFLRNLPDRVLVYKSKKTDLNNRDENSPYSIQLYIDIQAAYQNGKLNTLTYAYDGDKEYDTLVFEYKANGEIKRAYFQTYKYGSYYEAFYSGAYPDSINVFASRDKMLFTYATVRSTYAKDKLTARVYQASDKSYSVVHSAKYDASGNLTELYKKSLPTQGYNQAQYAWVYEYTEGKISKCIEYYYYSANAASDAEEVMKEDYITAIDYYTFNDSGYLLTRRNLLENMCMKMDVTNTYVLDSKNMVIERKLVNKSKSKCGGY